MSTELEIKKTSIGVTSRGLQITSLDEAWRFAQAIVKSGMAPKDFQTAERVLIAMQHGWEIGLSPMQALQSISVINNRPALWGDVLPGLVQASGLCEYVKEFYEGDGDALAAVCVSKRSDQAEALTARFSVADAKKAGLWGKAGPWTNYPKRMLKVRARAFNFRDNFADVLRGLAVAEEVMDTPRPQRALDPSQGVMADTDPLLIESEAVGTSITPAPATADDKGGFMPSEDELAEIHEQEKQLKF